MNSNVRKYVITGVILGSIAAVAAGVIGLTNLITAKRIEQNKINKINEGIATIFDDGSEGFKVSSEYIGNIPNDDSKKYYEVYNANNDNFLGYAIQCEGSNMYGKIVLIAGFEAESRNFIRMSLVTNEQSYATTVEDNYVVKVNEKHNFEDEDVKCGATYGATLVRDLLDEAHKAALTLTQKGKRNG